MPDLADEEHEPHQDAAQEARERYIELSPRCWSATRARLDPEQLDQALEPLKIREAALPVDETLVVQNFCNGSRFGSRLHFCAATAFLPTSDWAGGYHVSDPRGGLPACLTPNPYTGSCSCPQGTTAINMRTTTVGCGGTIGSAVLVP